MPGPTVVILQPNYIPWLGNFDLVAQCDIWVWYDDVQYTRRDWRNRNRVAAGAAPVWLTVPVRRAARESLRICEAEIDYQIDWPRRHLETLRHCYGHAPHYAATSDLLRESLDRRHPLLADLVVEVNETICAHLGLRRTFLRSSMLDGIAGDKTGRLLAICERLSAGTYLSGPAAANYLEVERFAERGIAVRYAEYRYPEYDRGGGPFIAGLSIVDPLCWVGAPQVAGWLGRQRSPAAASD